MDYSKTYYKYGGLVTNSYPRRKKNDKKTLKVECRKIYDIKTRETAIFRFDTG